jgi:hypothetical protein
MRFDVLYEKLSDALFEKFEGMRKVKDFPGEEPTNVPYYGKGGKNLKTGENAGEITKQQLSVYKKVFDELSKRGNISYEDLMNVSRKKFSEEGQNSTTAMYNAKRFANFIHKSLAEAEDAAPVAPTSDAEAGKEQDTSKFDAIADDIDKQLSKSEPESGFYSVAVKDIDILKDKMRNLFKREGFERTDAYGVLNVIMSEPASYFNFNKLIERLDEDGELTGTLTKVRVKDIIKKLIQDNVIVASEKGAEPSEEEGVAALEPAEGDRDFSNPNTGRHEAERITGMSGSGFYKKPGFGGHNPFKDRELE